MSYSIMYNASLKKSTCYKTTLFDIINGKILTMIKLPENIYIQVSFVDTAKNLFVCKTTVDHLLNSSERTDYGEKKTTWKRYRRRRTF